MLKSILLSTKALVNIFVKLEKTDFMSQSRLITNINHLRRAQVSMMKLMSDFSLKVVLLLLMMMQPRVISHTSFYSCDCVKSRLRRRESCSRLTEEGDIV